MNTKKQNFGWVKPVIDNTHYILGGAVSTVPKDILQPDGNWEAFLPSFEAQETSTFDTDGCQTFGTLNAIETLMKRLFGGNYNYAERYPYNIAHIRPPGGDPHAIAEIIRKNGLITEELLPMTTTYDEFITPDPMTSALLKMGQQWLDDKNFLHEWVFTNNPPKETRIALLKEALNYSPVAMSVTAWDKDPKTGLYVDDGQPNCHWVELYNMDDDGTMYVLDSYDFLKNGTISDMKKVLSPDHHIEFAKRYHIGKKNLEDQIDWFTQILRQIGIWLGFIQKEVDALPKQAPTVAPEPLKPTIPTQPIAKYEWGTKDAVRHSIRVIADEEGLTVLQKDLTCDIAQCESQFDYMVRGKLDPRDRGLFQWNSHFHPEITDEIAFDPEKNARLGCKAVKSGKAHAYWSASEFCWNKTGKYNSLL